MEKRFDVLVAEENDIIREKIAGRFSRQPNVRMVTQVSNLALLVETVLANSPDLILADIRFAQSVMDITAGLRSAGRKALVYLMADTAEERYERAAIDAGAAGLVEKQMIEDGIEGMLEELVRLRDKVSSDGCGAVMVADDDAFFRMLVGKLLGDAGISNTIVSSGVEAVKEVLDSPGNFGCVVLDIHMGGMNGFGAARLIRHMIKDMPIILMSSDDSPETLAEAEGIESARFLPKPFKPKELLDLVNEEIEKRRTRATGAARS